MHRSQWAMFLALAGLISAGVRAQGEHSTDDVEAVRAAARRGMALYELAKYDEALKTFELAYEKKSVPALLFNIAQCHRQLGHLEQAARVYKSYLRSDPPEAAAKQARDLLATVEDAVNRQKAAIASPPHELSETAPRPAVAREPAPTAAVPVRLPQPAPATPAAAEHHRWPVYAAAGVAAAAAGLGAMWGVGSRSATNELAQLHRDGNIDPTRDAALRSDASSQYSRSKVAYAAAAVAAVSGVVFYFAF